MRKAEVFLRSFTQFEPRTRDDPFQGLAGKTVALIGMGFSANKINDRNRKPGISNLEVANIMSTLWSVSRSTAVDLVILPQREVAEALEKYHPDVPINHVLKEIGSEGHISSHDILYQAWKYAKVRGVKDAIIVAHRAHLRRSEWNAALWGFRIHHPHACASHYAPESTQPHTRNAPVFFVWDMLARMKLIFLDSFKNK